MRLGAGGAMPGSFRTGCNHEGLAVRNLLETLLEHTEFRRVAFIVGGIDGKQARADLAEVGPGIEIA